MAHIESTPHRCKVALGGGPDTPDRLSQRTNRAEAKAMAVKIESARTSCGTSTNAIPTIEYVPGGGSSVVRYKLMGVDLIVRRISA
jgi:hypothetical protein